MERRKTCLRNNTAGTIWPASYSIVRTCVFLVSEILVVVHLAHFEVGGECHDKRMPCV